jgi:predicted MFS family arabinose efflux permease
MQKKLSLIWHDAVGGLPPDFWILWSGILVNRIGAMAFPFLSFFLASKGFSGNVAALAVSCWGIGGLTATFFGGWSADRIGRKPTLLAGLVLSALAMLAMPWGNSVLLIDLCAFLAGFAFDFQRPAVSATVADLVPVSDRVRAFGLTYWAINIGASLAPLIGGVLAAISFFFLFTFDAVSSLCYFVLILFRLREPAQHLASTSQAHSPFAGFSDRRMLLLFLLSSFLTSQFFQAYSTLPLVMRLHGMNAGDYSRAIMTNGLTVVILSIPLSRLLQRWLAARALALAAACVGIGFFLTQFAQTVLQYAGTVFRRDRRCVHRAGIDQPSLATRSTRCLSRSLLHELVAWDSPWTGHRGMDIAIRRWPCALVRMRHHRLPRRDRILALLRSNTDRGDGTKRGVGIQELDTAS